MRYIIKIIAVPEAGSAERGTPYWAGHDDLAPAVHTIRALPLARGEPLLTDRVAERLARVELLDRDGRVLGHGHLQETRRTEH